TVRLDGDFDSKIGARCDPELKKYIAVFYGDIVEGRLAVGGGSKKMTALLSIKHQKFAVPKPLRGTLEEFQRRALAVKDGQIAFEGFCTPAVDCARAFLSMINSAFLVLYHQGWRDFSNPGFDHARFLLHKGVSDGLTNSDWESIQDMAGFV